ncbi:hypothetical protein [Allosediminivita pacifica]|uniref:Glycosyl transferase family 2 n=1 Tax=Allosediminivita pacifica TaxID=1267769 RepID=A0A2T6AQH9_9RHOB|nr:hypothetical protein [Allosediminivita pacifica]PTX46050.1 hypothetical protein C8N44_11825 [Allosediminivita pacifica]GGB18738.1 hypothetical protein GCM10011324_31090 [Allosediminivita pacifica]
MAQAPATPKWKRRALRLAADIGLPTRTLRPAPSEKAALALRAAERDKLSGPAREVIFLIPLVAPSDVSDWAAVTTRLEATLQSFISQDDTRWRAVICCQERPPLPNDPRITHLPFDEQVEGNDKWRKLAALCSHLKDSAPDPAYVMSFDADDILRQGTVAEMLGRQAPGGYIAETGYVLDAGTGTMALAAPADPGAPGRKAFWKLCGSCVALRYDPGLPECTAFLRAMTAHEHRMFPYLAGLAGRRLEPFGEPRVLYILNHGENFGARRGRTSFKTRYVERFALSEHGQRIAREGFPPL